MTPQQIHGGLALLMGVRFDMCKANRLIPPLFANLKFSLSSVSCQRDRDGCVPLMAQRHLRLVNRTGGFRPIDDRDILCHTIFLFKTPVPLTGRDVHLVPKGDTYTF